MSASLEEILIQAAEGDPSATEQFLRAFLESRLLVPDRYGNPAPTNAAPYPSELTSLMAIREDARVLVPCFTTKEQALAWSPQVVQFSELSAQALLERLPDDWWLVLNPEAEATKEFSPWEIRKLKDGERSIAEVVADLSHHTRHSEIEVRPLEISEADALVSASIEYADRHEAIQELYAAMETSRTADQEAHTCVLIGLLVKQGDGAAYSQELFTLLEQKSIGDHSVRVIGSSVRDSLQFSVFSKSAPVWQRIPWWKRIVRGKFGKSER